MPSDVLPLVDAPSPSRERAKRNVSVGNRVRLPGGPEIERLVRSAAYAAECPTAVFYLLEDDRYTLIASTEGEVRLADQIDSQILMDAADGNEDVLIVNDLTHQYSHARGEGETSPDCSPSLRFLAAVPMRDGQRVTRGILAVADRSPQAGLSAAKIYVLRTHAAQLTALLELYALHTSLGVVQTDKNQPFDTERLRLLESVVVNANDAILITQAEPIDLPGPRIVYCNAAFTRTTGYSEAEVLGRTPRILQSEKTDRTALDRLRKALSRWKPIEVELLNTRKDGTEFWVELSIVPVANEKGWFTHWVSVQRDVSDRKIAEETATRARIVEAQNQSLEAEITERKRVEAQLLYTAFHDDLTKLRNRAFFMERLTLALARTRTDPDFRCAVMFMDLDRFKLVNDSLGHRAGDLLLMEVSDRLRTCMRSPDTLARVGGDEFAVLIEGADAMASAVTMAERMIEVMRRPIWLGTQEVFSSCSVGIVETAPHHELPEEVVRDADIAMYEAKRAEVGGYAVFAEAMRSVAVDALEIQTDLQNAVTRSEFYLEYQPIWAAPSLELTGMEALVRWQHPQRGSMPPSAFIEAAEDTGLIRDIGRWVLSEACGQMRIWQKPYSEMSLRLSVNTSAQELKDPGFMTHLERTFRATGLEPCDLQIEITESVFIEDAELVEEILMGIRALGVRVALDDFGTGFSSLSYLDRYPLDAIKIDRSFVAKMLTQPRTFAIVQTIVRLGQILNLDIIAEGVEEEAQLQALAATGCNSVQGFLIGAPMSAKAFEAMISKRQSATRMAETTVSQEGA